VHRRRCRRFLLENDSEAVFTPGRPDGSWKRTLAHGSGKADLKNRLRFSYERPKSCQRRFVWPDELDSFPWHCY